MPAIDRFLPPRKPAPVVDFLKLRIGVWVPTCWSYRYRADLCRRIWQPACERMGWQVVFYDEGENEPIYSPDAAERDRLMQYNLAAKIKRMVTHAIESKYDYIIRTDTDCMLWPERFDFSRYANYDYIGNHTYPPGNPNFHYASGMCYILSRKAMILASKTSLDYEHGREWAEDRWIGRVMHVNSIPLHLEPRIVYDKPWDDEKWIAWHDFGKWVGKLKYCPYLAENERQSER